MKKLTVAIIAIIVIAIYANVPGQDKHDNDNDNTILVMMEPDVIGYTDDKTYAYSSNNLPISLRRVMRRYNIEHIDRAVPEFTPEDTRSTSKKGEQIELTDWSNLFELNVRKSSQTEGVLDKLRNLEFVQYAERNRIPLSTLHVGEFDPIDLNSYRYEEMQWNMKNRGNPPHAFHGTVDMDIDATDAWARTQGSNTVRIAVIDPEGFVTSHEDWGNNRVQHYGPNHLRGGHGTAVVGILAAKGDNGIGIAGVDWNAQILSCTVDQFLKSIRGGIEYAVEDWDADILNFSWGMKYWSDTIYHAVKDAYTAGVFIAQASRQLTDEEGYSNAFGSFLVQVSGYNKYGAPSDFTLSNPLTDIAAPGGEKTEGAEHRIITTLPDDFYDPDGDFIEEQQQNLEHMYVMNNLPIMGPNAEAGYKAAASSYGWSYGTSIATPHVAGAAGLLIAYNEELGRYNSLHHFDMENILKISAEYIGPEKDMYGAGRLNINNALTLLEEPYTLVHSTASLDREWANQEVYFYSDPFPPYHRNRGNGPGWYNIDLYKMEDTYFPGTPYEEYPSAWFSMTGYKTFNDPAADNYEGAMINALTNYVSGHTYFVLVHPRYDIENDTWAPFCPTDLYDPIMSVLGIPNQDLPSAPGNLDAAYNPYKDAYNITWNRNPTEEQVDVYRLDRKFDGNDWIVVSDSIEDPGAGESVSFMEHLTVPPGTECIYYRVRAHNSAGWGPYCLPVSVYPAGGGELESSDTELVSIPRQLSLDQNYPNPFNPTTVIRYGLPNSTRVKIWIMNARGQLVRTLVDGEKPAGWYTVTWDGKNENGVDVASGIYLYLIETDEGQILKKMTLFR